ncbi:MAG TPA: aminoacyl-tRNA hydrolase, partial [Methanocorpusculum sp.]|nr:aminoacyl-tRNA hydrolase [Methanocorpusculum sp.]
MTVTEEQELPNTKSLNQFKDGAPDKNIDSEKQTEKKTKRSFGFGSKSSEDTGKKSSSKININKIFGRLQKNKNKTPAEELSAASIEPPKVLEVPEFIPVSEDDKLIEQYWLTPPYASTAIYKDRLNKYHYKIIEPQITEKEFLILEETFEYLRSTLIYDSVKKRDEMQLSHDTMKSAIKKFDKEITDERTEILIYYLFRNFMGYGKLDPLMNDEMIEDITCNGSDIPVFLYHRRYGGVQTNCIFAKEELNKFVLKLSQKADKQLSLTTPLVDAALP